MSKVLITGASGFVGLKLVTQLRELSHEIVEASSISCNIADPETWSKIPRVDLVIHLAGRSYVPDSWNDPAKFMHTNVMGTEYALEYCRHNGSRLIFVSAYLYGRPAKLPIDENDAIQPNNPYALSKYLAEQLCQFYSTFWNIPVTVIRPFNIFGPGQRQEFLIPKIVNQVMHSHEICVKDLAPRRDYIYIDDVINALIKALNAPEGFHLLNIGSGISYSVREIIDIIQEEAATKLPVRSEQVVRQQEIFDVRADISYAKKILDWSPCHSFSSGIKKLLLSEEKL